jgi:hypothetical protein
MSRLTCRNVMAVDREPRRKSSVVIVNIVFLSVEAGVGISSIVSLGNTRVAACEYDT